MRRQRNRLLHAARLEVGGRDQVQFVVAGSRDQQIAGIDMAFRWLPFWRRVEQSGSTRGAHNPKTAGSNPAPAIQRMGE